MAIFENSYLSRRKANLVMSLSFFPRAKKWLFPRLCRSYLTNSLDEPHVIGGAFPPMKVWNGVSNSAGIPSWTLEVPNLLCKSFQEIRRNDFEMDQTKTMIRYADQAGVCIADFPDQLLFKRILSGGLTSSTTTTQFGKSYQLTMDGQPMFGVSHTLDGVTSQQNEIQGSLPGTVASIAAQDIGLTAQQLQRDLILIENYFQTVKNNQNMPIYPNIDLRESIVLVGPPCLSPGFALAFRSAGAIVGGSPGGGGSNGSSSSIGPMFVKDAFTSGYMNGFPDPESLSSSAMILPPTPTTYYAFIVNDLVAPFYMQNFRPMSGDGFPPGYNIDKVIAETLKEAREVGLEPTRDQAAMFASMVVEHNLNATGANAQWQTAAEEKHFISPRARLNVAYGPWITALRIDPAGTSGGVY